VVARKLSLFGRMGRLSVGIFTLCMPLVALANVAGAQTEKTDSTPLPLFGEWIAYGSGCKASDKGKGDAELILPQGKELTSAANQFKIILKLPDYKLDSANGNPRKSQNFARQCSLRVGFNPPAGKRIKMITAKTEVMMSKASPVDLLVSQEVKLGSKTIASNSFRSDPGTELKDRSETIVLSPTQDTRPHFESKKCGFGTLVGIDQTFMALRKNNTDAVYVALSGEKQIEMEIHLESCSG
jgi:hypothetical protein